MGGRVKQGVGTIYVTDDSGERHAFTAGQDVPEWAQARMVDVIEDASASPTATDGSDADRPPKRGAGSGIDAWRAYAEGHGFDVADDATRDDIIAAVEADD